MRVGTRWGASVCMLRRGVGVVCCLLSLLLSTSFTESFRVRYVGALFFFFSSSFTSGLLGSCDGR